MRYVRLLLMPFLFSASFIFSGNMSVSELASQAQDEIDLEKGLVAYWKFDDDEGDIIFDETGNYNDAGLLCSGEECSPPIRVEGKVGFALKFDGKDDYLAIPDSDSLQIDGNFTITFWIKRDEMAITHFLFSKRNLSAQNGANERMEIAIENDRLFFSVSNGLEYVDVASAMILSDKRWYFITCLYKGNNASLYIDSKLERVSSRLSHGQIPEGIPLYIGKSSWSTHYFNGIMDEVRIYNRALSEDEIYALYQQGE